MAAKKSSGYDLTIALLKKNAKISYADVRNAAAKKKLTVYPIVYGRAKAALGLVPVSPRGKGKAAKAKAKAKAKAQGKATGRPRGRPRGRPAGSGAAPRASGRRAGRRPVAVDASLEALIQGLKSVQRDNDQLRSALTKVRDLLDAVV